MQQNNDQPVKLELLPTREDVHSISEDREANNEEQQSTNEELLSGNAELQSPGKVMKTVNHELAGLTEQVITPSNYFESIVATIAQPLLVLDKNLRIRTANTAFYKTFKVAQSETEDALIYDLGNREWDIPALRTLLEEVLPHKSSFKDFEVRNHFTSIGERVILLSGVEIKRETKEEKLILLAIEDITAKAIAQKKIEDSNKRYNLMLMQSPFAFSIMKGKNMVVTLANNLMKEFWGKGDEVEGKTLMEILPELKDQPFPGMIDSVYETGKPVYANEMLARLNRHGTMEEHYFDIIYQPHLEADETISGVITIAHNVTNQVLARKSIEEREAFNRSILDSIPDCIKIFDNEGRLQFMNKNGICLMEIDDFPKFKNKYWWELWEEKNQLIIKDAVEKARNGEKVQFQIFGTTSKGTPKWWDIIVLPIQVAGQSENIQQILSVSRDITEQKQAALKLEASEYRYQEMIYSSPSLIAILKGENNIITIANDAIVEIWGKGKEVIGKPFLEAMPELVEQHVEEELRGVYTTGIPSHASERPVHFIRDGKMELKYYNYVFQPQRNSEGTIAGIAIIGAEVTSQALLNNKIKASEEQFRLLVLQAPVAICVLRGANYVIEVINERMSEMWDRTVEETINNPVFDVLTELRDQGLKELLDNVYHKGERFVAEELPINLKRKGKLESAFVKFIYEPLREADGTISGVMALAHEITEQVVNRKKMEAQALLFQKMLMTSPGFVCTLEGPDHVYELVNERYQQLFGKRKIQGKSIIKALPELEGQGFVELLDKVYSTGETYVGIDIPIMLARDENLEPEKRYFNFSYQPMYDETNTIFSILVFGYEVTDQVMAKNKSISDHEEYATMLEQKVKERTLELSESNRLLLKTNEDLLKINLELESFNYVASHDLQEPLRKIQTFSKLLIENESANLSSKGKDYFGRMRIAADRMQKLIEDLLVYSKISVKDRTLELTSLSEIIKAVENDLSEIIAQKGASVEVGELCDLRISPFQFRQLFNNLVNNSLKFSQPGLEPHITIKSKTEKGRQFKNEKLIAENNYCHITISDNGIGFDPQYKDRIFEIFQRLHGKDEYEGTGIGLSIVKKIVENHHGIISVSSEPGKGTIFDIYIPS